MPDSTLDYVIHGAGGIGCVVAARLTAIGRTVGLVARGAHLEALQTNGLTVVGHTEASVELHAAARPSDLAIGPETVIILAMKTGDTAAALDAAGDCYADLPVFCFQNGVANEELVRARGLRAYGCRVILGGRILEPGVVAHTGSGVLTLGIWPNGIDDVCRRVAADLIESGLEAPLTDDVEAAKWGKVLSNVNNAYLALVGISVQESRHFEIHRHFLADVLNEAIDVIEAAGISADTSPQKPPRQQVASLRAPGDWEHIEIPTDPDERTYPSTWQDLHFERDSVEVEWFNGEIVRLAQRHGMAAPLNETLWHRCEAAAAAKAGPGTETPESLRS